jgi:hypothetical protein
MGNRPALIRIDQSADGTAARVVITLEWEGREYHGEAGGDPADAARARLLGEATLRAVEGIASDRFDLEAIATTNLGDSQVAMAQVAQRDGGPLVGSALLHADDPGAAPVRAVLDAINRKLGF